MLNLFNEVKSDLEIVEEKLLEVVQSPDPLLTEAASQLIKAGGKRLRPAFSLLGGKFYNFDIEKVLPLAVALELIHMSTLVHDDVVDASYTRRNTPTAKARYGNRFSTHMGDYLLGKSLILISSYENNLIPQVLSDTSVKMCEGEIYQIAASYDSQQTTRDYFYRINRKTAYLIAASCQLGAAACGAPAEIHMPLRRYGHNVGMAFQITDDILDMTAEQQKIGKPIGGDLRQGIITLPVIYALNNSRHNERLYELVHKQDKTDKQVYEIISIIEECGGLAYSGYIARRYIEKAKEQLEPLPGEPVKDTLKTIAEFINARSF